MFFRRRAGEAEALFVVNDRDDVNYFCLGLFLCIAEPSGSEAARRLRPPTARPSPPGRGEAGRGQAGGAPPAGLGLTFVTSQPWTLFVTK